MADKNNIQEINQQELQELIERIEHAIANELALSVADMKLLLTAISTLCTVQYRLEQTDVTLYKLRKLLGMIQKTEKRPNKTGDNDSNPEGNKSIPKKRKKNKNKLKNKKQKIKPNVVHHKLTEVKSGDVCQHCNKGKLYKHGPANLLRITAHSPYEAARHVSEQLKCNLCDSIKSALLPDYVLADGDSSQQYGYSARSMMSIYKFFSGVPYYHQGNLSSIFGCAMSASTIYDQCEHAANAVEPVFDELKRIGSNAFSFDIDDTGNKILEQKPEFRKRRNGKGERLRTGVYSSGLIALLEDGKEIALFETSLGHAGEHLDSLLEMRDKDLPAALLMSDALSNNNPTHDTVIRTLCNVHCRRMFVEVEHLLPDKIEWVLDTYGKIWHNETIVQGKELCHADRLEYHKQHSLPVMEQLRDWALEQKARKIFEENSAFGKAANYLLRHYDELIMFCKYPGALIDNNRMEETLRIIIRGRNTAYFFKTVKGAKVANIPMALS